jgi:hypothetical protein
MGRWGWQQRQKALSPKQGVQSLCLSQQAIGMRYRYLLVRSAVQLKGGLCNVTNKYIRQWDSILALTSPLVFNVQISNDGLGDMG